MSAQPSHPLPAGVTGRHGVAGGQLAQEVSRHGNPDGRSSAGWSENRNAAGMGAAGERRTGKLLDAYASRALVLHDLRIPLKGVRANVDHAVVSGDRILLIDTKVWNAGTYWTFGTTHRLGTRTIEEPLGRAMTIARDGWSKLAEDAGGALVDPVTVVWPARAGSAVNVNRLKAPVGSVVAGTDLLRVVERFVSSGGPAAPTLARAALSQLVSSRG